MTKLVTRFAPSPTGFLHIGGARTALFNWLLAKHYGGKTLLRIEDTDKARSTQEAVDALLGGLQWLGLDWDGETVFQSANAERHVEIANKLLEKGEAYYCQCTPEELEEMRDEQKPNKQPIGYDRRCCGKGHTEGSVRIKSPHDKEGEMHIKDSIQGDVKIPYSQLDDMILLRSDGTPTYMLSVVVDDHDMSITHVVRGDDHLNNAFRQKVIYDALGWEVPQFAHIPLIHGSDGAKLSKRHGATGLEMYRDMGYLPEAMQNYLLRLGWGHGDTEIISSEDAIKLFTLEDIGKSPSRMDFAKLAHVNAHYMRQMPEYELLNTLIPIIEKELGENIDDVGAERLKKGMHDIKERAQTLVELAHAGLFYVRPRPLFLDEEAVKLLDEPTLTLLAEIKELLSILENFTSANIQDALKAFSKEKGLKLGKVAMPLRAVLTGTTSSPSIFNVAEILGKEEVIARIGDVI